MAADARLHESLTAFTGDAVLPRRIKGHPVPSQVSNATCPSLKPLPVSGTEYCKSTLANYGLGGASHG